MPILPELECCCSELPPLCCCCSSSQLAYPDRFPPTPESELLSFSAEIPEEPAELNFGLVDRRLSNRLVIIFEEEVEVEEKEFVVSAGFEEEEELSTKLPLLPSLPEELS